MTKVYHESDLLPLSSLQHYVFCKRQYALIYIEGIWHENVLTAEGRVMHEHAHDSQHSGIENGLLVIRALPLKSLTLGVYGVADVVEFFESDKGIRLINVKGKYIPHPVEYKRGRTKTNDCDRVQLCAQALCLEEMLNCHIQVASIFYGEPRRREKVMLDQVLRTKTIKICEEVHKLYDMGVTPEPKFSRSCKRCSIIEECNPGAIKRSAVKYWEGIFSYAGDDIS